MTELQCAEGPRNRWRIGPYEFQRYTRAQQGPDPRGRWGCCYRNQIGVANFHTPVGAFLGLRRWIRTPKLPGPTRRVT